MHESLSVCVRVFVGSVVSDTARCFQKRWASGSPCGNAQGDRHSRTPDHGSAPGHTKTHNRPKKWRHSLLLVHQVCVWNPTPQQLYTCPCGSTRSRWRTVAPSMPLSTYWPEAELLSLTRKSPLHVSSASACSLPNLGWRTQSYWQRTRWDKNAH